MSLSAIRDRAVGLLKFTRWYSNNLLQDIPESKWAFQPSPTCNNILWCMGHLAGTEAWFGGMVGFDAHVPESVSQAYGMGSKPGQTGNPPAAEVRAAWEHSRAAVIDWLQNATEAQLQEDLKPKSHEFFNDPVDAALKLAWHEGFHFGQVANVRKALGLPATM